MTLATKNLSANADVRDAGSIPRLGRSSGGGHGKPPVLAWRTLGTGEPGGLLSMGLHRVGHD